MAFRQCSVQPQLAQEQQDVIPFSKTSSMRFRESCHSEQPQNRLPLFEQFDEIGWHASLYAELADAEILRDHQEGLFIRATLLDIFPERRTTMYDLLSGITNTCYEKCRFAPSERSNSIISRCPPFVAHAKGVAHASASGSRA